MHNKGTSLLSFPDSYVVLDIETTGLRAEDCEVIEVAAIKVVDGKVVDEFEELIRPYNTVDGQIISLTKITNSMLEDKRRFNEVGEDFKQFVGDNILVAHNANFDVNFLIHHFKDNELGKFSNDFIDTLRLARVGIKDTKDHKLETLLDYFDIKQTDSHRAMIDVVNTHKLYLELKELNKDNPDLFKPRRRNNFYARTDLTEIESETPHDEIDKENYFYNKKVSFTCDLLDFVKEDVAQTIVNLGGDIQKGVTLKTDILILGDLKSQIDRYGKESSKHLKALDYIERGQDLEIIEEQLLKEILDANGIIDTEEIESSAEAIKIIDIVEIESSAKAVEIIDIEKIENNAEAVEIIDVQEVETTQTTDVAKKSKFNSLNFLLTGIISFIILFFISDENTLFTVLSLILFFSLIISFALKIKELVKAYKAYKIKKH